MMTIPAGKNLAQRNGGRNGMYTINKATKFSSRMIISSGRIGILLAGFGLLMNVGHSPFTAFCQSHFHKHTRRAKTCPRTDRRIANQIKNHLLWEDRFESKAYYQTPFTYSSTSGSCAALPFHDLAEQGENLARRGCIQFAGRSIYPCGARR